MVTICYKDEKNPSKLVFLQDFAFTSEAHITKKLKLLKHIVIFSELTTKILLKTTDTFPKIDH